MSSAVHKKSPRFFGLPCLHRRMMASCFGRNLNAGTCTEMSSNATTLSPSELWIFERRACRAKPSSSVRCFAAHEWEPTYAAEGRKVKCHDSCPLSTEGASTHHFVAAGVQGCVRVTQADPKPSMSPCWDRTNWDNDNNPILIKRWQSGGWVIVVGDLWFIPSDIWTPHGDDHNHLCLGICILKPENMLICKGDLKYIIGRHIAILSLFVVWEDAWVMLMTRWSCHWTNVWGFSVVDSNICVHLPWE